MRCELQRCKGSGGVEHCQDERRGEGGRGVQRWIDSAWSCIALQEIGAKHAQVLRPLEDMSPGDTEPLQGTPPPASTNCTNEENARPGTRDAVSPPSLNHDHQQPRPASATSVVTPRSEYPASPAEATRVIASPVATPYSGASPQAPRLSDDVKGHSLSGSTRTAAANNTTLPPQSETPGHTAPAPPDCADLRFCIESALNLNLDGDVAMSAFCSFDWPVTQESVLTPLIPVAPSSGVAEWYHTTHLPLWRQKPSRASRNYDSSHVLLKVSTKQNTRCPLFTSGLLFMLTGCPVAYPGAYPPKR